MTMSPVSSDRSKTVVGVSSTSVELTAVGLPVGSSHGGRADPSEVGAREGVGVDASGSGDVVLEFPVSVGDCTGDSVRTPPGGGREGMLSVGEFGSEAGLSVVQLDGEEGPSPPPFGEPLLSPYDMDNEKGSRIML